MSASEHELITAYSADRSLKRVAARFGMCAHSVHKRLRSAGVDTKQIGLWKPWQIELVRERYMNENHRNKLDLNGLAEILGKNKSQVCKLAAGMGLTTMNRTVQIRRNAPKFKTKEELSAHISKCRTEWIAKNGHPRGALGMKHSKETKEAMSIISKNRWHSMTKKQQEDITEKSVLTRIRKNTPPRQRHETSWKAGWREIGSQRIYARSRWEANIARMLEFRRMTGDLISWEHEPLTFWFEKIRRGVRSYKPDFRVVEEGKEPYFIEVKGWMDARSKTTLRRMKKYHPSVVVDVIESKRYAVIKKQLQYVVEGWESDSRSR